MDTGTLVANIKENNCGTVAYMWCTDANFQSTEFQAKPRVAVTVAAWIYLVKIDGSHSVFHTVGSTHPMGQYHFEVNYGNVRWFHRNESQNVVFEAEAHEVKPRKFNETTRYLEQIPISTCFRIGLSIVTNSEPGYLELRQCRTNFDFPCEFEIAGLDCSYKF